MNLQGLIRLTVLIAILLLNAAFVFGATPPDLPGGTESVCVPPGVPPFSSWKASTSGPIVVLDERNRPILGLFAAYEARGQKLNTIWVGPILASVDPAPDDPSAPSWHDRGAVTPTTALRVEPRQACDWFRGIPPPPEAPGELQS